MRAERYPGWMRGVAFLALLFVALVACSSGSAGSAGTSLRISVWEDGATNGIPDSVRTLRCNPPRGTLARPARACTKLAASGPRLFAETPRSAVCTQLYGGPQVARIVGTFAGKRISTSVSRKNGCEIARWQRLSPWLLPPGGVR